MKEVIVRQEQVTIPTYPIAAYDKNPMFLENGSIRGQAGVSIRILSVRRFRIQK